MSRCSDQYSFQHKTLTDSVERYLFWSNDYKYLSNSKEEFLVQLIHLKIAFEAKGFAYIDRRLIANVRQIHQGPSINCIY